MSRVRIAAVALTTELTVACTAQISTASNSPRRPMGKNSRTSTPKPPSARWLAPDQSGHGQHSRGRQDSEQVHTTDLDDHRKDAHPRHGDAPDINRPTARENAGADDAPE